MSQEEDQANEFEALAAIFDADFHITHDSVPRTCELVLVPNADGENNHVAARLFVELPAEYPAAGQAKIRVRSEKGLMERHIAELTALIADKVSAAAEANEVAVYTVAEAVREYIAAPERNTPALSMHEQMAARQEKIVSEEDEALAKRRALEERIAAKKKEPSPLGIEPGTLLTPESFAHWRALFDAEQKAIREAKEAARPRQDRLTGKQLFQQNLAKELGEAEAEQLPLESAAEAAEAAGKGNVFFFNEDLFLDEDLDDDEEGAEADEGEADEHKHAISDDDDDDDEDEEDDDMDAMFDTTTNAEKQARGANAPAAAAAAASAAAASAAAASAAAAAAAKKPAAASSRPAASAGPPGFSKPAAAAASASASGAYGSPTTSWEDKHKDKPMEGKKKKEKEVRVLTQSEKDKAMQGKAAQQKRAAALAAKGGGPKGGKK